jgi:hypothetical protein
MVTSTTISVTKNRPTGEKKRDLYTFKGLPIRPTVFAGAQSQIIKKSYPSKGTATTFIYYNRILHDFI